MTFFVLRDTIRIYVPIGFQKQQTDNVDTPSEAGRRESRPVLDVVGVGLCSLTFLITIVVRVVQFVQLLNT